MLLVVKLTFMLFLILGGLTVVNGIGLIIGVIEKYRFHDTTFGYGTFFPFFVSLALFLIFGLH